MAPSAPAVSLPVSTMGSARARPSRERSRGGAVKQRPSSQ
jgi:hypothetical protein